MNKTAEVFEFIEVTATVAVVVVVLVGNKCLKIDCLRYMQATKTFNYSVPAKTVAWFAFYILLSVCFLNCKFNTWV